MKFDIIKKVVDFKEVWENPSIDFGVWLKQVENAKNLFSSIDVDISIEDKKYHTDGSLVTFYSDDKEHKDTIMIENQLEESSDQSLGKVVRIVGNQKPKIIIWIVQYAKMEHRKAIQFINEMSKTEIFMVELAICDIPNVVNKAIHFTVLERPNSFVERPISWQSEAQVEAIKTIKTEKTLSVMQQSQLEYWTKFNAWVGKDEIFMKEFSLQKPQAQSWHNLTIGSSKYYIVLRVGYQKKHLSTEIYVNDSKEKFRFFEQNKQNIEGMIEGKLEWREASKDCRIVLMQDFNVQHEIDQWEEAFSWHRDMALKFKKAITTINSSL